MDTAPLFDDIADGPDGGAAYWIEAADGVRLRLATWGGGDQGSVLLIPGRTEYIEKYGQAAGELRARGFSVAVLDYRGQGLADRVADDPMIGHVGAFSDYQLDVRAALDAMGALGLGGPVHMLCHSLGGAIGLRAAHVQAGISSVAYSAPMWGIKMPALLAPIAPLIAGAAQALGMANRYVPGGGPQTYVMSAEFDGNTLTKDRAMWDHMVAQARAHPELTLGSPSFHWLRAALRECRDLSHMPAPKLPCLTYLGSAEAIVAPAAVHAQMARWTDGRLELIADAEHEIMMEIPTTRSRFFDDITTHFRQNAPAPLQAARAAD